MATKKVAVKSDSSKSSKPAASEPKTEAICKACDGTGLDPVSKELCAKCEGTPSSRERSKLAEASK